MSYCDYRTPPMYTNYDLRKKHHKQREEAIRLLGGQCIGRMPDGSLCGWSDPRALQFDHINGDGCKSRAKPSEVLKHPERFQLLCANHNWIKRVENHEDGSVQRKQGLKTNKQCAIMVSVSDIQKHELSERSHREKLAAELGMTRVSCIGGSGETFPETENGR